MARGWLLVAVVLALALVGCGGPAPAERPVTPFDPAEAAALSAPLLTDPDLAAMSRRYELVSFDAPIPASQPSPSTPR